MTAVMLAFVADAAGDQAVATLLHVAGSHRSRRFLETNENWISLDEAVALLEASAEVTGLDDAPRRIGARTVQQHAGTSVSTMFRSLGSPEAILEAVTATSAKFSTVTEMSSLENAPGRCVVRAAARPGFQRHRVHCLWAQGLLSTGPTLFGLPPGHVEEETCQARGDAECRYVVTWDAELAAAGADPEERITALEAQLIDMQARTVNVYASAGELVSAEDLDVVLARIVERAALTVRAPRFVLIVRLEDERDARTYSDGVPRDEVSAIAAALEAGQPLPGSTLIARVASDRRAYGWLCALYTHDDGAFFAQEQELFSLYATYAAAVLDMATALAESLRRHEDVSALLSLSRDLARGGDARDVADRLVAVVPGMIDCDRVSVWLWDESAVELQVMSRSGAPAGVDGPQLLTPRTLRPGDSPYVGAMRDRPETLSIVSGDVDDVFLQELIDALGLLVLVVVPIVARGEFVGVLTAAVAEEPERLGLDEALCQRLNGIAALAATAIQNARLIDELSHQASHDALTGAANRAGFTRRMSEVLDDAAGDEHIGLLYIDLDGFKSVNDRHGHDIGDALLQQVSNRLSAVVRAGDTVARIGGDEFAVILARASSLKEISAATGRIRKVFEDPFAIGDILTDVGASIGVAHWPADGDDIEALLTHADAAMYRNKTSAVAQASPR